MAHETIYAAIDIGTNSILLLVAKKNDGADGSSPSLVPLLEQAQTVRLGEGLAITGHLSIQAVERTITELKRYLQITKKFSPLQSVCFGTEALRRASNAEMFRQRVKQELNLEVRILSPEEEAHYTFLGALGSLPDCSRQTLVIDIGGGSTEIIYGTADSMKYQQSFPVGAVIAKEVFQLKDEILSSQLTALQEYLRTIFDVAVNISQETVMVLTGGTATTLAALDQKLQHYDIKAVDGYCISTSKIERLYARLNQLSLKERADLPGMEAGRADIILPALVILLTVLDHLNIKTVQISVRGARYGILLA